MSRLSLLSLIVLSTSFACGSSSGDDDDGIDPLADAAPNSFIINGSIAGDGARPGDFNVLFTNTDNVGSLHVYGLGRSVDGESYNLALPPSVPMEAQIGGTVAVGHVVMTEIDDAIEEGRPSSEDGAKIIGVSTNYMIIYRAAPFVEQFSWESDFPNGGWACGICQQGAAGIPDRLAPAACSSIVVDMGAFGALDACNPFVQQ